MTIDLKKVQKLRDVISKLSSQRIAMENFVQYYSSEDTTFSCLKNDCGTAGCIAGWTLATFSPDTSIHFRYGSVIDAARNILGLSYDSAYELFMAGTIGLSQFFDISREREKSEVLAQLDWILAGNEPNWVMTFGKDHPETDAIVLVE